MRPLGNDDPVALGDYRLLGILGAGGMGRVYLGRTRGGRTVAVKVVRPDLADDGEFRIRFRREVAAARRVGGRYTVPVLDADVDAEHPWLATAFVAGPDLGTAIANHGPLPEPSLRALTVGLARALIDIHAAGLVHRDLKPSNVLLTMDGPRVIDFGIARAADDVNLTTTGQVIGSPGYLCPERITGTAPVGPAADIFALGAVLAFAATGTGPFGDGDPVALLWRVVAQPAQLDGAPDTMRGLLEACLAKEPGQRPTIEQVLERALAWGPVPARGWLPGAIAEDIGRLAVELLDLDGGAEPGFDTGGQGLGGAVGESGAVESGTGVHDDTGGGQDRRAAPTVRAAGEPAPTVVRPQDASADWWNRPSETVVTQPDTGSPAGEQGSGPRPVPTPSGPRPLRSPSGPLAEPGDEPTIQAPPSGPRHPFAASQQPGPRTNIAGGVRDSGEHRYSPQRPHTTGPHDAREPQPPQPVRRRSRRPWLWAAAVVLVVAVAGGSAYAAYSLTGGGDDAASTSSSASSETESATESSAGESGGQALPEGYVGSWTGTGSDMLASFDITVTLHGGNVGEQVGTSRNTEKVSKGTCERAETLVSASGGQVVLQARLTTPGASCTDDGEISTLTLNGDGSMKYETAGGVGAINGTLHRH
ncbi:protein kinase [Nocardia sp. NPDC004068]|uniref:serine/threonine-protein kinase n=1 Tax=Nocardia sp. NPDC004068 TaxID=3364303 RepID=UPI0036774DEF